METKKTPPWGRRLFEFRMGPVYLPFFGAFLSAFLAFFAIENLLPTVDVCCPAGSASDRCSQPLTSVYGRMSQLSRTFRKIDKNTGGDRASTYRADGGKCRLSRPDATLAR